MFPLTTLLLGSFAAVTIGAHHIFLSVLKNEAVTWSIVYEPQQQLLRR
jgi:hypothetical protein